MNHRTPRVTAFSVCLTVALALIGAGATADADAATRRVVQTDGQGDASMVSRTALRGPNGPTAARAGATTRSADGSVQHRSAVAAQGAKGSVESSGSASKTADGQVAQERTTTATRATTGNSVTTTGTYNSATGRARTTTCYDATGAMIACPARP